MPNRNIEGNYRYKFQGQEKDAETGKEAFELRLWDGRIGRWLTVDPAGEFFSPYLGMGNNPISNIDPDGGCVDCDQNAANGSKYTDVAGANWTKGADGWGRSDGYSIDLGSLHNVRMDGYFGQTQFWMKPGEKADTYKSRLRDAQQRLHDLNWFTLESIVTATSVASGALSFGGVNTSNRRYNFKGGLAPPPKFNINSPNSFKGANPNKAGDFLKSEGWTPTPSNPNKMFPGTRYQNGVPGEQIRIMPGDASRSIHVKQGPHMIISRNGVKSEPIPLMGNPTLK